MMDLCVTCCGVTQRILRVGGCLLGTVLYCIYYIHICINMYMIYAQYILHNILPTTGELVICLEVTWWRSSTLPMI